MNEFVNKNLYSLNMCTLHKKLKKTKPFTELPQPLFVLCHGGLVLSRQIFFHTSYMWLHHYHDSSTQSTLSSFCGQSKMQGGRLSFHPSFYFYFFCLIVYSIKKLKIGEIKLNKEWH